jgi:hypothetical protein
MSTWILSTIALLACVFLIYVFFQWLREELNPKKPAKRYSGPVNANLPRRPFIVRPRHRNIL